jgi:hypothetical protein
LVWVLLLLELLSGVVEGLVGLDRREGLLDRHGAQGFSHKKWIELLLLLLLVLWGQWESLLVRILEVKVINNSRMIWGLRLFFNLLLHFTESFSFFNEFIDLQAFRVNLAYAIALIAIVHHYVGWGDVVADSVRISIPTADDSSCTDSLVVALVISKAVDFKVVLGQHLLEAHSIGLVVQRGVSLLQGEEDLAGEQAVWAGLVGRPESSDCQHLCKSAQPSVLIGVRKLTGEGFDVIDGWEEELQVVNEDFVRLREVFIHGHFEKVSKVIASVVADPFDIGVNNESRHGHFLSEVLGVDASGLELLEVNAAVFEHVDGGLLVEVILEVEVEVELPCADGSGELSFLVGYCDAHLDEVQDVYIWFNLQIFPFLLIQLKDFCSYFMQALLGVWVDNGPRKLSVLLLKSN